MAYDSQNRRVEERVLNTSGTTSTRKYTFKTSGVATGKRDKREEYDKDGNLIQYIVYQYDSQGRFSGIEIYLKNPTPPDTLQGRVTVEYNAEGKQTTGTRYNADDTVAETYTYTYNSQGLLSRKDIKNPLGVLVSYSLFSYEQGPLIGDQMEYFF